MRKGEYECIVIGAGPAGAAVSVALLRRGVRVLCIDSKTTWTPTYGVWPDELSELPYEIPYANIWDEVLVSFGSRSHRRLQRPYARIDGPQLSSAFFELLRSRDALRCGRVSEVRFSSPYFSVQVSKFDVLKARFVIDATGHEPRFLHRPMGSPAFQTAVGKRVVSGEGGGTLGERTMGLMLWDNGLEIEQQGRLIPAFLYVMPVSCEVYFAELTILAARPSVPIGALQVVLDDWLRRRGMKEVERGAGEERVFIPMGHPLPDLEQPMIGIGGAASQVHPATGYMFARSLRTAERLADAVAEARNETAVQARAALWRAVWPEQEVRSRAVYELGLEAVLGMGAAQTRDFFQCFFDLPDPLWRGYLAGSLHGGELAEAMWMLFRDVPIALKMELARTAIGRRTPEIVRALRG